MTATTPRDDAADPAARAAMPALYAALAKAQGAFKPIAKNRSVTIPTKSGSSYQFRYADLDAILAATRPALSANGLALIQQISDGYLVCRLTHADGGTISSDMIAPTVRELGDPKAFGATITYLRRYLVTAILGVAADDDLDEDGEEAADTKPARRAPAAPPAAPPPYPADRWSAALRGWAAKIAAGEGSADTLLAMLGSRYTLTPEQRAQVQALAVAQPGPADGADTTEEPQ